MRSISLVVVATTLFGASNAALKADALQGCYKSTTGMTLQVPSFDPNFNSVGSCGGQCKAALFATYAMEDKDCYCGQKLPPSITLTDASNCNLVCPGWQQDQCGGAGYYSVYVTGLTSSVTNATAAASDTPSKSSSTTSAPTASKTTLSPSTIVVTAKPTSTNSSTPSTGAKKSASNTVGIAVGVVVGMIVIAAMAGGLWLFFRNKKKQEIEEEHRRQAAVNVFVKGGKPGSSGGNSSFTDTRLDPVVMSQRRMSDGSIADNQDYSRRILKVTNA